jgi:hypothetical protein
VVVAVLLLGTGTVECVAQTNAVLAGAGEDMAGRRFELREMDLHLHAGMERPVDLPAWIDLAVADGRRVLLLLDHLELYRKTPEQYEAWRAKGGYHARYPVGDAGRKALWADFAAAARRKDVLVFKGWEVSESELDSGLELSPLRSAEAVGFHISPRHGAAPPNGQSLLKRARQLKDLQKQLPIPLILFHPFPMRLENLQQTAKKNGRAPRALTVSEYRFFQPGEQEALIRLLQGTSIYVEMSRATERYFEDPVCREALIADLLPLAKAGVQFTVSTDNHSLAAARTRFDPERYCGPVGVTPLNSNPIVRELLARRARPGAGQ